MLRSLYNIFSIFHQICALKGLEAEVVVIVVTVEVKRGLDLVLVFFNNSIDIVGQHRCGAADLIFNFGIETVSNFEEAGTCALVQI